MNPLSHYVAFDGSHRAATAAGSEIAAKVSAYLRAKPEAQLLIFDCETGRQVDLDLRAAARMDHGADSTRAGKGRPRLGVVAKEVTLLPRHWDWLARQPGGASVTLRRLVERASKEPNSREQQQSRTAAAYHFMQAVAGNLPGFEEASRLLFAGNLEGLGAAVAQWPGDIGDQVMDLAGTQAQSRLKKEP